MKVNIVDENRAFLLNPLSAGGDGDVLYLMSREQRLDDNWSFLYALSLAGRLGRSVTVLFVFNEEHQNESVRRIDFLVRGLKEVEKRADEIGVVFKVFSGSDPLTTVTGYISENRTAAVVCDFNPLRHALILNKKLAAEIEAPVIEVDAHNIVPCRAASDKQEFGAYTLRKKIEAVLPMYLTAYPLIEDILNEINYKGKSAPNNTDWSKITGSLNIDDSVRPVQGVTPGYRAGMIKLNDFIENRLGKYDYERNDPTLSGQSGLSPYIHFGHISAQSAALRAAETIGGLPLKGGFLDEIIVRRELSDNYCLYNMDYDNFNGFPNWAKQSLNLHSLDEREYLYELTELESASTHDRLWNAAQNQMVKTGIMHGYMRMYWAKKILEWSPDSSEALKRAIYLNDIYSLDGKDPNGYSGCAWSIGGLHDRAWGDRPVFGKIRYMNDKGCKRKFDTELYISQQKVSRLHQLPLC